MKFALFPNLLANLVPSSQRWIPSFINFMFLPKIFNRILSDKIQKYSYFYVRKADFQPWYQRESKGGSRHNENILHLLFLIYVWVRTYALGTYICKWCPTILGIFGPPLPPNPILSYFSSCPYFMTSFFDPLTPPQWYDCLNFWWYLKTYKLQM